MATTRTADEQAAADERANRAAALAAGGALAVAVAADGETVEASPAKRAAAAATIVAALVTFLADQRTRFATWMRGRLGERGAVHSVAVSDIELVVAQEEQRAAAFAQRQAERFARDLQTALAIPDRAAREGAIRGLMAREEVYARQHVEAQAARAFAAIDRVVLRGQSPQGAFWKLDPTVVEHTAGCLLLGGRFWPWAVLDRVHPPRHHGCPCRLLGYGEAIADGLMGPGAVMDVRQAIRRAAAVVMEAQMYSAEVDDAGALRDLLFEAHLIGVEESFGSIVPAEAIEEAHASLQLGLDAPDAVREAGLGLGYDRSGFFVYTISARSPSYAAIDEIPSTEVRALGG